jgi:hypothetical protein
MEKIKTNPAENGFGPLEYHVQLWGDYEDRSLFSVNNPMSGMPDMDSLYVGPDGRPDGVIIVVSAGE